MTIARCSSKYRITQSQIPVVRGKILSIRL
ncbi:hypothetical protein GBAR_LOCUS24642 [Geodia barretti]|uniref:Uncharacterized protein n=1 Tax=Geodia barretti TaxID=519541 RepID=A0AA35TCI9_GEOBA|nr:hypothetical protein GBAR_LOCUS24642 [Geodia barretti]